jgi:hypothetical protein
MCKEKARATKLIAKHDSLKTSIDRKNTINTDFSFLSKLGVKCEYASKLISNCIFAAGILPFAFLALKFFL